MIRSLKEIRNKECKDCDLHKSADFVCLPGYGQVPSKIMIIGEAPGYREDESGVPFVGKSGRLLDTILETVGLDRDKVYITNVVHCRPPDNRTPSMAEMRACRKYLIRERKIIRPKIIVTLGNIALKGLFNSNTYSVKKERGKILDYRGIKVIPTYHPAAALRASYYAKLIYEDLQRGLEMAGSSSKLGPKGAYTLITTDNRSTALKRLLKAKVISLDVETSSLDMFDKKEKLICIGISDKAGEAFVFPATDKNLDAVFDIVEEKPMIIGHGFKFDLKWLRRYGIKPRWHIFDTMVAMHLLDENYPDKSLKHLALTKLEFGQRLSDAHAIILKRRADGEEPTWKEWLEYNGGDADATFQLFEKFMPLLNQENLDRLMHFQMVGTKVLTGMEYRGFKIDMDAYRILKKRYESELEKLRYRLRQCLGDINLNSTTQLADKLYNELKLPIVKRTPTKAPSCDEEALTMLMKETKEHRKTLTLLLEYRNREKLHTTYIKGLITRGLIKSDGRVHCNYKITGTVTGRLSCKDPNLQNIPREGDLKLMFTSSFSDGRIIQVDYSQVELRVLAHYARSLSLINAFKSGRDIHREVAAKVFRKSPKAITEQERKFTKQVNFGIIYLISAQGLADKLNCTRRRAYNLMQDWFREFPEVKEWINEMKSLITRKGEVITPMGRKRRFYKTDPTTGEGRENIRKGVNFPIQSLASDITVHSMIKLYYSLFQDGLKARVVANVHDAVLVDCPRKEVRRVASLIRTIFLKPPVELRVPLDVEIKVGKNWGSLEVYDGK